jgi:hypothetical protein
MQLGDALWNTSELKRGFRLKRRVRDSHSLIRHISHAIWLWNATKVFFGREGTVPVTYRLWQTWLLLLQFLKGDWWNVGTWSEELTWFCCSVAHNSLANDECITGVLKMLPPIIHWLKTNAICVLKMSIVCQPHTHNLRCIDCTS